MSRAENNQHDETFSSATDAMIKAGARAARSYDPRVLDAEDLAILVYQAMEAARRKGNLQ